MSFHRWKKRADSLTRWAYGRWGYHDVRRPYWQAVGDGHAVMPRGFHIVVCLN